MRPPFSRGLELLATVLATSILSAATWAADYTIDQSHAFIQFRISHLGFSVLNGRFNDFSGEFSWDKDNPGNSAISLKIKTASIDSNWAERDKHIRSAEFLDVEKFPEATFKSTKYTGGATDGILEGVLTLHGVSKPITLKMRAVGEGDDPWGGYRAGFTATTTIDRNDFGISYDLGPAAKTMEFDLFIEGIRK
jgi:polyisoprenoid-binding protein YceI